MARKYRIGVIGYGGMGANYVRMLQVSPRWEIACVCDVSPAKRDAAQAAVPGARVVGDMGQVLADPTVDVVGLFTLADHRPAQIRAALAAGKHVLAEKPLAADVKTEWELVKEIEASGKLVAVNLFNRNAWYHHEMQAFIASGQIGKLGIVRCTHMTPGLMVGEGHLPEGPPFHDCGMHYVDVARWYARSEYDRWHATGVRMWGEEWPWWVQAHGYFKNGVAFEVTQGFVYGQLAKDKSQHCGFEGIGTLGFVRMWHDFDNVHLDLHGVSQTVSKTGKYGSKKLDVMIDLMARSLDARRDLGLPSARDAAVASEVSWAMLKAAAADHPPAIGTPEEMERILAHRREISRVKYG